MTYPPTIRIGVIRIVYWRLYVSDTQNCLSLKARV